MNESVPRYIDEKEVSKITGLALPTLRNWRFKGIGMPYSKVGRSVRYALEDVLDYMESRKVQTDEGN
jgi:predicted DNA-binding transcriptional regulator AlpA